MTYPNFRGSDSLLDPPCNESDDSQEEGVDYYICDTDMGGCGEKVYYDAVTFNRESEQELCIDCWENQFA